MPAASREPGDLSGVETEWLRPRAEDRQLTSSSAPATPLPPLTLVLGGARSGKSAYAETLFGDGAATYVATAEAGDDEMRARIEAHRRRRGDGWQTVEAPVDLAGALRAAATAGRPVLVDCLTLWLSNLMAADRDIAAEFAELIDGLAAAGGPVVLVSNEVGLGIVPDNALARAFRDHAGRLHQAIAAQADRVVLMIAGLPLTIKDTTAETSTIGS